jgi:hypothetical protein
LGSLHCGKETISRNVSAVHFITMFCFISGIYKLFWKQLLLVQNNTTFEWCFHSQF